MTAERITITPRLIIGLGILILGTLWTLDNLRLIDSDDFTDWWPVIVIAVGAVQFMNRRANRVGPVLLMIIGALLLASSLGFIDFDLGDLIPLAIAAWGAKLVWDALARRSGRADVQYGDDAVHAFAVMGGVHWHTTSHQFRGGDVNAIMGGVEVDLRDARVKPGEELIIDTLAMMGGIEIFVPADWRIQADVLPIMGAFENNTKPTSGNGPVLTIRGAVVMGGVEVKN